MQSHAAAGSLTRRGTRGERASEKGEIHRARESRAKALDWSRVSLDLSLPVVDALPVLVLSFPVQVCAAQPIFCRHILASQLSAAVWRGCWLERGTGGARLVQTDLGVQIVEEKDSAGGADGPRAYSLQWVDAARPAPAFVTLLWSDMRKDRVPLSKKIVVEARLPAWSLLDVLLAVLPQMEAAVQKNALACWSSEVHRFITVPTSVAAAIGGVTSTAFLSRTLQASVLRLLAKRTPAQLTVLLPAVTELLTKSHPFLLGEVDQTPQQQAAAQPHAAFVPLLLASYAQTPLEDRFLWRVVWSLLQKFAAGVCSEAAPQDTFVDSVHAWQVSAETAMVGFQALLARCSTLWNDVNQFCVAGTADRAMQLLHFLTQALGLMQRSVRTQSTGKQMVAGMGDVIQSVLRGWGKIAEKSVPLSEVDSSASGGALSARVTAEELYGTFVLLVQQGSEQDVVWFLVRETPRQHLPASLLQAAVASGGVAMLKRRIIAEARDAGASASGQGVLVEGGAGHSLQSLLHVASNDVMEPALAIFLDCVRTDECRSVMRLMHSPELVLRVQRLSCDGSAQASQREVALRALLILHCMASEGAVHVAALEWWDRLLESGCSLRSVLRLPFQDGYSFATVLSLLHRCDQLLQKERHSAAVQELAVVRHEQGSFVAHVLTAVTNGASSGELEAHYAAPLLAAVHGWATQSPLHVLALQRHQPAILRLLAHPQQEVHATSAHLFTLVMPNMSGDDKKAMLERFNGNQAPAVVKKSPGPNAGQQDGENKAPATSSSSSSDASLQAPQFQLSRSSAAVSVGHCGADMHPWHIQQLKDSLQRILNHKQDALTELGNDVRRAWLVSPDSSSCEPSSPARVRSADAMVETATTAQNLSRVLEAATIGKPQLIQGASGVGKSATIRSDAYLPLGTSLAFAAAAEFSLSASDSDVSVTPMGAASPVALLLSLLVIYAMSPGEWIVPKSCACRS